MASAKEKILILGAGELGFAVLESLVSHPQCNRTSSIAVLLRRGPSAERHSSWLKSNSIAILEADVVSASAAELTALFTAGHYSTIIGCTGMTYPAGTQLKLAQAVLEAQTPRYIPWQFAFDYDEIKEPSRPAIFDEQVQVRNVLRGQQKTKWCIVNNGLFISFLLEPRFGVVIREGQAQWKVRSLGSWENLITVTDANDVARVVAELVWKENQRDGIVFIAGETLSYDQIAKTVAKVVGDDKVERVDGALETLKEELSEEPEDWMKKDRVLFAIGKGVSWDVKSTLNHQWGMKMLQVEDWAKEHLSAQQ